MRSGFHWKDGWYFRRLPDGSVEVTQTENTNDPGDRWLIQFTIPPAEWASIVTSVSRDGETADRWNAAQDFHGREPK